MGLLAPMTLSCPENSFPGLRDVSRWAALCALVPTAKRGGWSHHVWVMLLEYSSGTENRTIQNDDFYITPPAPPVGRGWKSKVPKNNMIDTGCDFGTCMLYMICIFNLYLYMYVYRYINGLYNIIYMFMLEFTIQNQFNIAWPNPQTVAWLPRKMFSWLGGLWFLSFFSTIHVCRCDLWFTVCTYTWTSTNEYVLTFSII